MDYATVSINTVACVNTSRGSCSDADGTAIGANAEEAQEGQARPDFIAKLSISRKEARETRYWLRLAIASGAVNKREVQWELEEVQQLIAMIVSAIKTAQRSSNRG